MPSARARSCSAGSNRKQPARVAAGSSLPRVVPSESEGLHDRIRERPTVSVRYGTILADCRSRTRSGSAASRFDISCGNRPTHQPAERSPALPQRGEGEVSLALFVSLIPFVHLSSVSLVARCGHVRVRRSSSAAVSSSSPKRVSDHVAMHLEVRAGDGHVLGCRSFRFAARLSETCVIAVLCGR